MKEKMIATIRFRAVDALMDMFYDIQRDRCAFDSIEERAIFHARENQFSHLLSNFVVEYHNYLSERWAAWLNDYELWYEMQFKTTEYKRSYSNCDELVLQDVVDYLYSMIPNPEKININSPNFLDDAAKVLASDPK